MKNTCYSFFIPVYIIKLYGVSRNSEACSLFSLVEKFNFKRSKCRSSMIPVIFLFIFSLKSSV